MKNFLDVFFYNSLAMSVITLCFLLSFRFLQNRYSAKWLYGMLLLITALWVFPFRPQIQLPAVVSGTSETVPVFLPLMFEEIANPSTLPDRVINTATGLSLWSILCGLWVIGIVAISAYYVIRHNQFIRFVNRWSTPITDRSLLQQFDYVKAEVGIKKPLGFKECKSIETPMLIGLFKPAVLLPSKHSTEHELYYILKHECIHYRQKDLYSKLLIIIATVLHWFNPIVWLMAKSMALQCELACDEQVLKDLDVEKRKQYGKTIINVIGNQINCKPVLSTNFYGGKGAIKQRIFLMMDNNKKKSGLLLLCILLLGLVFAACSVATEPESLAGYVVLEESSILVDEVEVIVSEDVARITALELHDPERMAELGLSLSDMPNGYYIYNPDTETTSYELTDETVYTFTDYHLLFVEDADGDRRYTTTDKEQFIQHLNTSFSTFTGEVPYPLFIEVEAGKVISITEIFLFTQ